MADGSTVETAETSESQGKRVVKPKVIIDYGYSSEKGKRPIPNFVKEKQQEAKAQNSATLKASANRSSGVLCDLKTLQNPADGLVDSSSDTSNDSTRGISQKKKKHASDMSEEESEDEKSDDGQNQQSTHSLKQKHNLRCLTVNLGLPAGIRKPGPKSKTMPKHVHDTSENEQEREELPQTSSSSHTPLSNRGTSVIQGHPRTSIDKGRSPLQSVDVNTTLPASPTLRAARERQVHLRELDLDAAPTPKKGYMDKYITFCIKYYNQNSGPAKREKENRFKADASGTELYLGEGIWIDKVRYTLYCSKPIDKVTMLLIDDLWDVNDLANRAIDVKRVTKPIPGRGPVEPIQKSLLALLISLLNDILVKRTTSHELRLNCLRNAVPCVTSHIRNLRREARNLEVQRLCRQL